MFLVRLSLRLCALICLLALVAYLFACISNAQEQSAHNYRPDMRRALVTRTATDKTNEARPGGGYTPQRNQATLKQRPAREPETDATTRTPAHPPARNNEATESSNMSTAQTGVAPALITNRIAPGTPLRRVLHTSQLSTSSAAGTDEQYADATNDGRADERATFDTSGGSFDLAVGRTGTRYEVFSAIDDRGTLTTSDDIPVGVLVTAFDTNGDFVRDSSATYDLHRDFNLPSAVAIIAGTSRSSREFVCVSSSGFFDRSNPNKPDNEPS